MAASVVVSVHQFFFLLGRMDAKGAYLFSNSICVAASFFSRKRLDHRILVSLAMEASARGWWIGTEETNPDHPRKYEFIFCGEVL